MNFKCQENAVDQLKLLASNDRQSLIIQGGEGSGKTFLAKQYANFVNVSDFVKVSPKVDDVRNVIDSCLHLSSPVVLCIENLDDGVLGASYALLKFLEEPLPNIYIVVTCSNLDYVPDTILSRSALVCIAPPTKDDIKLYSSSIDDVKYSLRKNTKLWKCVGTFKEAKTVLDMDANKLAYFDSLDQMSNFSDTISNMQWKLGHFDNNQETPIELVLKYIMNNSSSKHIHQAAVDCLNELSQYRIAKHAVLAKFLFEAKYCE